MPLLVDESIGNSSLMVLGARAEAASFSSTSLIISNFIVKYNNRVAV
jgi:hypothetical protein